MSRGIPSTFEGIVYPSRMALARHLAPRLGRRAEVVRNMLRQFGDDAHAVVRQLQSRPRRKRKPITYDGVAYPNRAALARHLARRLVATADAVHRMLRRHHDNVDDVLAALARQDSVIPGRRFTTKADFLRHLQRHYDVPERTLRGWVYHLLPEQVIARAIAWQWQGKSRRRAG
jgi:hypothetical protein